jgi:hypothetical protein
MSLPRNIEPEWLDTLAPDHPGAIGSRRDLRVLNGFMMQRRTMARLLARHGPPKVRTILELGAGDGTFMTHVAQRLAKRWKHYKAHFVTWAKYKSLSSAPEDRGQIPLVYNLYADPKERTDIFGASGGTPLFEPMARQTAQYSASFKKFPNNDYSKIKRSK